MDDWHPEALATIADRLGIAFTDLAPPRSQSFRTPGELNTTSSIGAARDLRRCCFMASLTARTWDYVAIALRADFRLVAIDTKSREVGHRLSSGRYEDLMPATLSMVS